MSPAQTTSCSCLPRVAFMGAPRPLTIRVVTIVKESSGEGRDATFMRGAVQHTRIGERAAEALLLSISSSVSDIALDRGRSVDS